MPATVIAGVEELKSLVGSEVGVSEWLEVTQDRIHQFAEATGDRQWIHVDPERARRESPYGAAVAHGFLTLSLLSPLLSQAVTLAGDFKYRINYGLNRLRFPAPVPAGSRIRARVTLQSVEEIAGGIQICWAITVDVEGSSKPALAAEWLLRAYF